MQNTYQEKRSYPINQDLILGKKLEGGIKLSTVTDFRPAGDQPEAIKKLITGVKNKRNEQWVIVIFSYLMIALFVYFKQIYVKKCKVNIKEI